MSDTTYIASQGDTLDYICWKFYEGRQAGVVEKVLEANRGLSELGPVIPVGTVIILPEILDVIPEVQPLRLWG